MFLKSRNRQDEAQMTTMPLLPLRDIVVFPNMVAPLFVGRDKSISALEYAMSLDKKIFLASQRDAQVDRPSPDEINTIGTIGLVLQLLRLPDGTVKALIEGQQRARINQYLDHEDFFMVEIEELADAQSNPLEAQALVRSVVTTFRAYARLNKKIASEVVSNIENAEDPAVIADMAAANLPLKAHDKQSILESDSLADRLEKIYGFMRGEIEILQIEQRIKGRVKKQMEKTQREYYLNEQMRAIQKEMGEKDDGKAEIEELERKLAAKRMPRDARDKCAAEIKKLKMMSPMSAEATVVRNYIDWILSLPWYERSRDRIDIDEAGAILDEDHYGLKKPKERILEYLAVQALVKKVRGPILCLVGPPGVGKTSLARSVARATNRSFIRMSLGGVRDEAEIRGHRRTYIGALPGKVIQSLRKVKYSNPVFCLDEVDKMSTDFRGDPAAALLEVLDPEQNYAFNDHYLDLDYDLSNIMFITTANNLYSIPAPLQDRMEIIRLAGYTEVEKASIARGFLIPKQLKANGLTEDNLQLSNGALYEIIRRYTREAGVRNLEREISAVCRKAAREVLDNGRDHTVRVNNKAVAKFLGVPKFRFGLAEEEPKIGLCMGLAWTEFGGEVLQTEVALMPGKGRLTLTGKLGDVMQESAQAAMAYVRSRADALGLPRDFYQKIDIHIHVPEGAIPKDGPSAGITLATTIVSALMRIPIHCDTAMTGEITLRGRVLPIGGLKEKIIAAHRAGIKRVIIPEENVKDLTEIPAKILKVIEVVKVENVDDVIKTALVLEDPDSLFSSSKRAAPPWAEPESPENGEMRH